MKKIKVALFVSLILNVSLLLILCILFEPAEGIRHVISKVTFSDREARRDVGRSNQDRNITIGPMHVVFLGDSITEQGNWAELFCDSRVLNSGVAGDTTTDMARRAKSLLVGKPAAVFIMGGINDLVSDPARDVATRLKGIIDDIARDSPTTSIYVHSILPTDEAIREVGPSPETIRTVNAQVRDYCERTNRAVFIDLWPLFADIHGRLNRQFTRDGTHLNGKGYVQWQAAIAPYLVKHLDANDCLRAGGLRPSPFGQR